MTLDRRIARRGLVTGAIATAGMLALPRPLLAQTTTERGQSAMAAAEELSRLEATEYIPALYTFYARLHPDARAIVPRHVVIGWYQDNWQPMGPHPAVATNVRFVDWTWPVNGVTYTGVAEVSFTQTFDNAPMIADVVRLAEVDGEWHWFFGRDRVWVEEQVAFYNDQAYIDQSGAVPFSLERVVNASPDVIASLPVQIGGAQAELVTDARQLPDYAARMPVAIQYRDREFGIGYAMATTLKPGLTVPETIDAIVWERIQAPPFRLVAWNLAPDNGVPFARYLLISVDVVPDMHRIVWGSIDGTTLWEIAFIDEARLEELARSLVALASR